MAIKIKHPLNTHKRNTEIKLFDMIIYYPDSPSLIFNKSFSLVIKKFENAIKLISIRKSI